jgi:hypothetical protein
VPAKNTVPARHLGWGTSVLIATYDDERVSVYQVVDDRLRLRAIDVVILALQHKSVLTLHTAAHSRNDNIFVDVLSLNTNTVEKKRVNQAAIGVAAALLALVVM